MVERVMRGAIPLPFSPARDRPLDRVNCSICGGYTSDGKPFCIKHLDKFPYVGKILETLKKTEDEISRVKSGKRTNIPGNSIVFDDIVLFLEYEGWMHYDGKARTIKAIAQALKLPIPVIKRYAKSLVHKKIVTYGTNDRKEEILILLSTTTTDEDEEERVNDK